MIEIEEPNKEQNKQITSFGFIQTDAGSVRICLVLSSALGSGVSLKNFQKCLSNILTKAHGEFTDISSFVRC